MSPIKFPSWEELGVEFSPPIVQEKLVIVAPTEPGDYLVIVEVNNGTEGNTWRFGKFKRDYLVTEEGKS